MQQHLLQQQQQQQQPPHPLLTSYHPQAYRSSLSLSPPASSSPSSLHRTSPLVWAAPAALAPSSLGPHTPPMTVYNGPTTVMEPFLPSAWAHGTEYDQGHTDMLEDQLLVKADLNGLQRPLHTYMAPLSLNSQGPVRPPSPPPSKKIDMRLAQPGTDESKPGYLTPLASYTAQTFWYFWYADMFAPQSVHSPVTRRMSENILSSTSRPFDSEGRPRHPIQPNVHPNQLQPNLPFSQFVYSVLHSTQVSFSVTILALMYTYKYKKIMALGQRMPYKSPVSEAQGFVTGLMLANKYLDDNTYTNATWSQFLGLPVKDVNEYELEWLDALEFNLCVSTEEFQTWRAMLDAHVRCRERGDNAPLSGGGASMVNGSFNPTRARSASPPLGYYSPPSASEHAMRKRSAKDAFSTDVLHNTRMYEAARLGPRKSSFALHTQAPSLPLGLSPAANAVAPVPTLSRSASLNRQIARLPANGRRDSLTGQEQVAMVPNGVVENGWHSNGYPVDPMAFGKEEHWRLPCQPRLYFLQAAATPQFGPDGRYHKAIPHYFDASTAYGYDANPYGPQEVMDNAQVDLASPVDPVFAAGMYAGAMQQEQLQLQQQQQQQFTHFGNPQPAPFANAGPPGYAYGWPVPQAQQQQQQQLPLQPQPQPMWSRQWKPGHNPRWSSGSDNAFINVRPAPICHSASEWSTPALQSF